MLLVTHIIRQGNGEEQGDKDIEEVCIGADGTLYGVYNKGTISVPFSTTAVWKALTSEIMDTKHYVSQTDNQVRLSLEFQLVAHVTPDGKTENVGFEHVDMLMVKHVRNNFNEVMCLALAVIKIISLLLYHGIVLC